MTEEFLALAGVVLGFAATLFGIALTFRASRSKEYRVPPEGIEALVKEFRRDLEHMDVSPAAKDDLAKAAADAARRMIESRINEDGLTLKELTDTVRTRSHSRKVEVERDDGSRVELGVDPRNPDSINDFLDGAKRIGAQRVVGVH